MIPSDNTSSRIPVCRPLTTVIICAFNEERTISNVVRIAVDHYAIDIVIVVDDGSTDDTLNKIESFRSSPKLEILTWQQNRGKGHAMVAGAKSARDGILLYLDSDIEGLTQEHITALLKPVYSYQYRMVLGYSPRSFKGLIGPLKRMTGPLQWVTGERALWRKDFLAAASQIETSGLGAEIILNNHIGRDRILRIGLLGLVHIRKHEKLPFPRYIPEYALEIKDFYQASQNHFLGRLKRAFK